MSMVTSASRRNAVSPAGMGPAVLTRQGFGNVHWTTPGMSKIQPVPESRTLLRFPLVAKSQDNSNKQQSASATHLLPPGV